MTKFRNWYLADKANRTLLWWIVGLAVFGFLFIFTWPFNRPFFSLFDLRILPLIDDKYFVEVLRDPDATVFGFVSERYHTWSSRVLIEAALVTVLHHIWLWRIITVLAYLSIAVLPIILLIDNPALRTRLLPLSAILVMAIPVGLIFETGYVATTLNYLWPFAAAWIAAIPAIRYLRGRSTSVSGWIFAAIFWLFAANVELVAGLLFMVYAATLIWWFARKWERFPASLAAATALTFGYLLFHVLSPGNTSRAIAETANLFPTYGELGLARKIEMGISSTLYAIFFDGYLLPLLFFATVALLILIERKFSAFTLLVAFVPIVGTFLMQPLNANLDPYTMSLYWQMRHNLNEYGLFDPTERFTWFAFILLIALLAASVWAVIKLLGSGTRAIIILGILAGGFATKFILAFSPTVWASGQRTNTFLLYAFALATLLLIAWRLDPRLATNAATVVENDGFALSST